MPPGQGDMGCRVTGDRRGGSEEGRPAAHAAGKGERLHRVILDAVPELTPRLWYGMPGYARGSGPVLCFFRADERFMTLGLTDKAHFEREPNQADQLMPSAWFFTHLDQPTERRVAAIVRHATAAYRR